MNTPTQFNIRETNTPIESVETYEFEPIQGYPMLNWKGKRPFRATQYYPAQLKETHGDEVDGWRNKIYWGDNLQVMSHLLKTYRGQITLIYIDPPFDSKAEYKKKIQLKGKTVENDQTAFEEKQYTDIWTNDEYLQFMYERLILMRELLADDGSIYLHCDWHKSHYLRVILDELFGASNFRNEVIWQRTSAHSDSQHWGIINDNIIYFTKTEKNIWNSQKRPFTAEYIKSHYSMIDEETGKHFSASSLTAAGKTKSGETGQPWRGLDPNTIGRHWSKPPSQLDELDKQGRIYWPPKKGGWPREKLFLDEREGRAVPNIWDDIPPVNSQAKEDSGYDTQKPEALLERIIKASSNPGDLVFDCFMGSGTTQAVAMKLGRRFIGADINLGAVQITTKRLLNVAAEIKVKTAQTQIDIPADDGEEAITQFYTGFSVYNVNHYDVFRNPVQAKDLLIEALEIQPFRTSELYDGEKDGRMVKIMPINRIATRADLNELITGFDYRAFERRQQEHPTQPVERLLLVCMGHEPDLAAVLQNQVPFKLDIEVVDILRDKSKLEFKRDAQARVVIRDGQLMIERFYPMNLLQKLSLMTENVEDWRELVESVMIDFNYDGAVLNPSVVDLPENNELVKGVYPVPPDAGTIRVKITDLLSESLEVDVEN